ncbi:MAG: LbtU family siderophore porin [Deltaproteobacteria bacterium]|nr:LbtU family siderophore porin [Deltaproteobacteria bacterium]
MNLFKKKVILFMALVFLCFLIPQPASSEGMSNYELEQEIKALEEKIEGASALLNKLSFSGAIELDYSYADDSNIGDNTVNDSTSDLDIGTVELGLEAAFHEYVTGNFILKGEALDTDDDRVFWDEATISIQKEEFPIYFVGGKRGQPFGMFESHLINDPITQDCYEIAKTGVTIGYTIESLGLDISATIYKGEELMGHLVEAEYGFARDNSPAYEETDDVNSYIGNITISPLDALMLSAYYDSEPGDGDRNETAGISAHYEIGMVTLDAEYIAALSREKNFTDNKEYNESAWFIGVAYQAAEPLEIAARYETFDDDITGEQDGHLTDRYSIGFTYALFENDSFANNLMGEYRVSNFEVEPGNPNGVDDKLNEAFLRLAIEF